MIQKGGQHGRRIQTRPRIMKKEPHAIDQQDAPPRAEGRKETGRKFILSENPEEDRRGPVGKGRFLKIDSRLEPRRDVVAGGVHRAGDGAVPPLVRLHEGYQGKRNQIQQEGKKKKNDYFDGSVLHDGCPGIRKIQRFSGVFIPQIGRHCQTINHKGACGWTGGGRLFAYFRIQSQGLNRDRHSLTYGSICAISRPSSFHPSQFIPHQGGLKQCP